MGYTSYLWDPVSDCVLQEYDGDENLTAEYTNEPSPFGPVLSQHRNGTTSDLLADALGSTRLIADDSGAVTDSFVYDAWGEELDHTGTTETPYRWVGQWGYQTDDELESVYVRARTYEPIIARWASVDPMGNIAGPNKYIYTWNKPNASIDPTGLIAGEVCLYGPEGGVQVDRCGLDVTTYMNALPGFLDQKFNSRSTIDKIDICRNMWDLAGWDISEFFSTGLNVQDRLMVLDGSQQGCATKAACKGTITINGGCYWAGEVNYFLWGYMNRLCNRFQDSLRREVIPSYELGSEVYYVDEHGRRHTPFATSLRNTLDIIALHRLRYVLRNLRDPDPGFRRGGTNGTAERQAWTRAGWFNDIAHGRTTMIMRGCSSPCPAKYTGGLTIVLVIRLVRNARGVLTSEPTYQWVLP